ncbi:MAG: hypothetical protein WCK53_12070, partial [Methanomicrobiales archaeon]
MYSITFPGLSRIDIPREAISLTSPALLAGRCIIADYHSENRTLLNVPGYQILMDYTWKEHAISVHQHA